MRQTFCGVTLTSLLPLCFLALLEEQRVADPRACFAHPTTTTPHDPSFAAFCSVLPVFCEQEHKTAAKQTGVHANVDHAFIRDRFAWKNRQFSSSDTDIEPLALWGSHDREAFFAKFARELGIAKCQIVRLRPMCVCVAGVEGGKLRAALRSMKI